MIRNWIALLFVLLFLLSCNENPHLPDRTDSVRKADSIFQLQKKHRSDSIEASTDPLWTDTLNWAGTVIDSTLPVFGNIQLLDKLGKPDSILVFGNDCGSPLDWLDKKHNTDSVICLYFPGLTFYSNRHQYLLSEIDLSKHELFIPRKDLKWNQHTTEEQFTAAFPRSARNARLNSSGKKNGELIYKISYRNLDDCWILRFQNGKLAKVKIWWLLC